MHFTKTQIILITIIVIIIVGLGLGLGLGFGLKSGSNNTIPPEQIDRFILNRFENLMNDLPIAMYQYYLSMFKSGMLYHYGMYSPAEIVLEFFILMKKVLNLPYDYLPKGNYIGVGFL